MTGESVSAGERIRGRLIGTEIEFGIVAVDEPGLSSVVTSTQAVRAYSEPGAASGGEAWDYGSETPLRDARGFDLGAARPTSAVDPGEFGITNRILVNGARFYVDHAHPEYSAPEVDTPLDAVIWDKAGERIMHRAGRASSAIPDHPELKLYKNNVDGKGASYGAHENYLVDRGVEIEQLTDNLAPHFISRQVFTGSGRVGIGELGEREGFQLSQRADYIEVLIGLETTLRRGIINTRDEPHADDERWRRLHVIIGDANLAELATYLKIGTTCLVLDAIEAGVDFSDLMPRYPVDAVHVISHDPALRATVTLTDGRTLNALQLQREILERCRAAEERYDDPRPDWVGDVLGEWADILDRLESDPMSCADRLDWPAKLGLLEGFRDREGLDWSHPRLALIDFQYSDIDPDRGLYNKLVASGRMRRLVTDDAVEAAVTTPPEHTRAWLRGRVMAELGDRVEAAAWDSIAITDTRGRARTIDLTDPFSGTRGDCEADPGLLHPDGGLRVD